MPSYRFGLDVGANSLGWSVLELDEGGKIVSIKDAGARIFRDGREPKSLATLAATRREKRQQRRRRDRFKQRQRFVLDELTKAGLFPEGDAERKALQDLNPLELRAKALTEKLPPHHVGRALFHLNQRRGFKSNRQDRSKENTSGKVASSIKRLLQQMQLLAEEAEQEKPKDRKEAAEARHREIAAKSAAMQALQDNDQLTFGYFLWSERGSKGKPTRARPTQEERQGKKRDIYDVYPQREMLEDEFRKIWKAQKAHHPGLLTEQAEERIHRAIFTQRPLRQPKLGLCSYLASAGELRTYRAMPSFQRYRIYQEVNNISWPDHLGKPQNLREHPKARDSVVDALERPTTKAGTVAFTTIKKLIKKAGLAEGNIRLNYETDAGKRTNFEGNCSSHVFQKPECVGEEWHSWPLERQDAFVALLMKSELSDEEVLARLAEEFGLQSEAAQACVEEAGALPDGTAHISLKAAGLMLKEMQDHCVLQHEAADHVAEENLHFKPPHLAAKGELLDSLPYYGEAFQNSSHIIPGDLEDPEDKARDPRKYYGGVSNPTVHIALNQIRRVINELIATYGRPASIAIELGREVSAGADERRDIEKHQKENQEKNERLNDKLLDLREDVNPDNRLKLRLWEELDLEDINGRLCPFSGERIGIHDLFEDGRIQIEHLIPWSISLDDSRANKVVCTRRANADKGKRTPHQAFGNSPSGYNWEEIWARAQRMPYAKRWRFGPDALERWQRDHDDFLARHLNDTRYIGRLAREYLTNICEEGKIDVITGRHTARLRRQWGMNGLLVGHNDPASSEEAPPKKSRDDHRHHAVDAIVVGMTTRSILQKLSESEEREVPPPWASLRGDAGEVVNGILTSYRVRRKSPGQDGSTTGQLHNDSAYGLVEEINDKGPTPVVIRSPIEWYDREQRIATIRNQNIRERLMAAFREGGAEGVMELARRLNIRRLRRMDKITAIPIKDEHGRVYKAMKGDSNWATEIYEYPAGHKKAGQWVGVAIPTHEANQKGFRPGQTYRPHPAARLVMRLFNDDLLRLDGYPTLMRVQNMTKGDVVLAPANEANVDKRNRDPESGFKLVKKAASSLQAANARKVHVSPSGRVSAERA